jgi:hypothetical protein
MEWTALAPCVPMTVGQQRHDIGRVAPLFTPSRFVHPDQLSQCQRAGIDADDSSEFVDVSPNCFSC